MEDTHYSEARESAEKDKIANFKKRRRFLAIFMDLLIVGGGAFGLSTAYHALKEKRFDTVTILDRLQLPSQDGNFYASDSEENDSHRYYLKERRMI